MQLAVSDHITVPLGDALLQLRTTEVARLLLEQLAGTPVPAYAEAFALPAIGQYWEAQGGVLAGTMRGENGQPDYHLIVPTDPKAEAQGVQWGDAGETAPGADSTFDGLANTTALAKSDRNHPAADWAHNLTLNGHSDYYLPSRRELRLCWVNVPELFSTDDWYWSSTQSSAHTAWHQYFGNGDQDSYDEQYTGRARAVRRVFIHSAL